VVVLLLGRVVEIHNGEKVTSDVMSVSLCASDFEHKAFVDESVVCDACIDRVVGRLVVSIYVYITGDVVAKDSRLVSISLLFVGPGPVVIDW
jgi:hypothetical protein